MSFAWDQWPLLSLIGISCIYSFLEHYAYKPDFVEVSVKPPTYISFYIFEAYKYYFLYLCLLEFPILLAEEIQVD